MFAVISRARPGISETSFVIFLDTFSRFLPEIWKKNAQPLFFLLHIEHWLTNNLIPLPVSLLNVISPTMFFVPE